MKCGIPDGLEASAPNKETDIAYQNGPAAALIEKG